MLKKSTISLRHQAGFLLVGALVLWAGASCQRPGRGASPGDIARENSHPASAQRPDTLGWPGSFGLGRRATDEEITKWDIDVRPDGAGLPAGSGTVASGRLVYAAKCASCHGKTGVEGPYNRLVATADHPKEKTIGNYWPYATTLFDYVRRAMPYNAPGSLTDEEVYGVTAFLLQANALLDSTAVLDAASLPKVVMPAQRRFVPDDRRDGPQIR
jgi:cytochrome c